VTLSLKGVAELALGNTLSEVVQMAPDSHFGSDFETRRHETRIKLAGPSPHGQDVAELLPEFNETLHQIAVFELAGVCLYDPLKNTLLLHISEGGLPGAAPVELPMGDTTAGWVWTHQQPLAFPDVQKELRFSACLNIAKKMGIHSFCELPLTTKRQRLGTLSLGSSRPNLYGKAELHLLRATVQMGALAIEKFLSCSSFEQETERLQALLHLNSILVSKLEIRDMFAAVSEAIRTVLKPDYARILVYDSCTQTFREHNLLSSADSQVPLKDFFASRAFLTQEPMIYAREELSSMHRGAAQEMMNHGIRSLCCIPLVSSKGSIGVLKLGIRQDRIFQPQDVEFLKQVACQFSLSLDYSRVHHEVAQLNDQIAEERRHVGGEIHSTVNFEEIVGESLVLKNVLKQAITVAATDATVLILGETGTGKELLARAIHRMSHRKDANFIKVNCAAIPTGLLESELFGHEKGAFTGAISQKIGRLELADKGTLLLDEVGDIALELQPKLLRVLQDGEFERLGGTRTIKVNLRLLAATNRDLAERMEEGEFRSDLYYRLNVFPIRMPALRERKTDIPLLVRHFVQRFSQSMSKGIDRIPTETIDTMEGWDWPGNIRELANFIERSVILSDGPVLCAPLGELAGPSNNPHDCTMRTLERDHIIRALRETGGVVGGTEGAAIRLGIKRTTLQSIIIRLQITREDYAK
jgi:formate hydrogenlyase transcriptional activator